MIQLIYLSFAQTNIRENIREHIDSILKEAEEYNKAAEITGQLIYRGGVFIQLLEGEEKAVQALMGKITMDYKRHENIRVLFKRSITERLFPDWNMAFRSLDDDTFDLVGTILPWQQLVDASANVDDIDSQKVIQIFETLKD